MKEIIEKECSRKIEKAKKHYFTKIPPNFLHSLDIHDNKITMIKAEINIFFTLIALWDLYECCDFLPLQKYFQYLANIYILVLYFRRKNCKFCEQIQKKD